MRCGVGRALALALLASLGGVGPAAAHGRSVSYSSWDLLEDGVRVRARIPLVELTRIPSLAAAAAARDPILGDYLASRLVLRTPAGPCERLEGPRTLAAPEGWWLSEWKVACPPGAARTLESSVLLPEAPSHLHFARVRTPDGTVRERVLSSRQTAWSLEEVESATPTPAASVTRYLWLGVEHIASGADHLAFLLALLLLAASLAEVATLVTGFTLAHSVTLGLAALGILHPDTPAVEALIGFSVALVAAENAWLLGDRVRWLPFSIGGVLVLLAGLSALGIGVLSWLTLLGIGLFSVCHFGLLERSARPARLRVAIAFAFGLVHGFGFAGVLDELALPRERLLPALFGFNAGVELGQLAIVAVAWPLLRLAGRLAGGRAGPAIAELASAVVCGLGVFWFTTRAFS
ncbi:MAG: HupE/UreJ family protein [Myxococcota bacterium]